jgi:hypothetical protein
MSACLTSAIGQLEPFELAQWLSRVIFCCLLNSLIAISHVPVVSKNNIFNA